MHCTHRGFVLCYILMLNVSDFFPYQSGLLNTVISHNVFGCTINRHMDCVFFCFVVVYCPFALPISLNSLRPSQHGRRVAYGICKRISMTESVWISIKFLIETCFKGQINNIPSLVQIRAWHRPGEKPLSEPMVVRLPMHIWNTRPQCVKITSPAQGQSYNCSDTSEVTLEIWMIRPHRSIHSTTTTSQTSNPSANYRWCSVN